MSLFDQKLFLKLAEIAKKAQLADSLPSKLIARLETQNDSGIATETQSDVKFTPDTFRSLKNFIEFARDQKITVGNQRVVLAENEPEDRRGGDYKLYTLKGDTLTSSFGPPKADDFFIDLATLKRYAQLLLRGAKDRKNGVEIMQVEKILGKLEQSFNIKVEDADSQNVVLDVVPQTLSNTTPLTATGTIELTSKDLADENALRGWVKNNEVSYGNQKFDDEGDANDLVCKILNYLSKRASAKASRATSPQEQKNAQQYMDMVAQVAFKIPCTLGSGGSQVHKGDLKDDPKNPQNNKPKGAAHWNDLFSNSNTLPLLYDTISLTRINNFVTKYQELAPNANLASVISALNNVSQISKNPNVFLKAGDSDSLDSIMTANLGHVTMENTQATAIAQETKNFIHQLRVLVIQIANLLEAVKDNKQIDGVLNDTARRNLEQQVSGANSYYERNIFLLKKLLSHPNLRA